MRAASTCDECEPCNRDGCCDDLGVAAKTERSPYCIGGCLQLNLLIVSWDAPPECLTRRAAEHGGLKQFEVHLDCPAEGEPGVPDAVTAGGTSLTIGRVDFGGGPYCDFDFEVSHPRICFIVRANDGSELLRCVLCPKGKDQPCSSSSSSGSSGSASSGSSRSSVIGSSGSSGSSQSGGGGSGSSGSSSSGGGGSSFDCSQFVINLEMLTACEDGHITYRFIGSIPADGTCGNPNIFIADEHGEVVVIGGGDFVPVGHFLGFSKDVSVPCTPGATVNLVVQLRCDNLGVVCETVFNFPTP